MFNVLITTRIVVLYIVTIDSYIYLHICVSCTRRERRENERVRNQNKKRDFVENNMCRMFNKSAVI